MKWPRRRDHLSEAIYFLYDRYIRGQLPAKPFQISLQGPTVTQNRNRGVQCGTNKNNQQHLRNI